MRHFVCLTFGLLLVLGSGCASLLPTMPTPRDFLLEYPPPSPLPRRLPVILRLAPVRAAAIFDREPIAYSPAPYRIGYYYYHRWVTAPSQMITDLLVRDLIAAEGFRTVQLGPSALAADYQLDVRVDRLEERMADGVCLATVVLRASLQDLHARAPEPVLLQRTYEHAEPVPCRQPVDLPPAFSRILQHISTRLISDVYDALAPRHTESLATTVRMHASDKHRFVVALPAPC